MQLRQRPPWALPTATMAEALSLNGQGPSFVLSVLSACRAEALAKAGPRNRFEISNFKSEIPHHSTTRQILIHNIFLDQLSQHSGTFFARLDVIRLFNGWERLFSGCMELRKGCRELFMLLIGLLIASYGPASAFNSSTTVQNNSAMVFIRTLLAGLAMPVNSMRHLRYTVRFGVKRTISHPDIQILGLTAARAKENYEHFTCHTFNLAGHRDCDKSFFGVILYFRIRKQRQWRNMNTNQHYQSADSTAPGCF